MSGQPGQAATAWPGCHESAVPAAGQVDLQQVLQQIKQGFQTVLAISRRDLVEDRGALGGMRLDQRNA